MQLNHLRRRGVLLLKPAEGLVQGRAISLLEVLEVLDGPLQGGAVPVGGDSAGEELDQGLDAVGRRVAGAGAGYLNCQVDRVG
jgi:hypothetical protein